MCLWCSHLLQHPVPQQLHLERGPEALPLISHPHLAPSRILGVTFVHLCCVWDLPRDLPLSSYTGKVYSLLVSEFRHVLMIDADCMPVQVSERGR